ncbi:E4 protein [Papillomaviridae sp. Haddock_c2655]|nr:E4 protein [Papillomaviridae sp. Haddock_c2655]
MTTSVGLENGGYELPPVVVKQMEEMLSLSRVSQSMGDQVDGFLPVHFHLSGPAKERLKLLLKGLQQLLLDQINYPHVGGWARADWLDSSAKPLTHPVSASQDPLKPSKESEED